MLDMGHPMLDMGLLMLVMELLMLDMVLLMLVMEPLMLGMMLLIQDMMLLLPEDQGMMHPLPDMTPRTHMVLLLLPLHLLEVTPLHNPDTPEANDL